MPDVVSCGLNMPSPDLLTPERAAATIWTWAPGHPPPGPTAPPGGRRLWSGVLLPRLRQVLRLGGSAGANAQQVRARQQRLCGHHPLLATLPSFADWITFFCRA